MKNVCIEVGLSEGSDILRHVLNESYDFVFGFEPVPHLAKHCRERVGTMNAVPYEIIQKAVDINNRTKKFYPAKSVPFDRYWNNGAGSLLEFSDELDKTWPGRPDLEAEQPIDVECTRLDDFIDERGISGIAYLEIDAQGKDLDVLKSLGDKIDIVERGHIEVPTSADVVLYKGQHLREETLNFLHEHGFKTERMRTVLQNEENYRFWR